MRVAKRAPAVLGLLAVAGCSSMSESFSEKMDDPMSLPRMIMAGTNVAPGERVVAGTVAPPRRVADGTLRPDEVYCPPVGVIEGGSALQVHSGGRAGDASSLRSQVALGQLARECLGQPDGSTVVKVGIQGRALLGAGAGSGGGRYDVPVRVVVKQGAAVIATRVLRTAVSIPPGGSQGEFVLVEDGIRVPPSVAQDFEIEVGLGGAGAGQGGRRRG